MLIIPRVIQAYPDGGEGSTVYLRKLPFSKTRMRVFASWKDDILRLLLHQVRLRQTAYVRLLIRRRNEGAEGLDLCALGKPISIQWYNGYVKCRAGGGRSRWCNHTRGSAPAGATKFVLARRPETAHSPAESLNVVTPRSDP